MENGAAISEKIVDIACQIRRHPCHDSFASLHTSVVLVTDRVMTHTAIQHSYDTQLSSKVNSIVYPNIKILPFVFSPSSFDFFFFSCEIPKEYV